MNSDTMQLLDMGLKVISAIEDELMLAPPIIWNLHLVLYL